MDYEALAKQYGGTAAPSASAVNYEALAKQYGGAVSNVQTVPQRSLGGAAIESISSIPSSAVYNIGNVISAFTHPVQTLVGLKAAATGGMRKIFPESVNAFMDKAAIYSLNPLDLYFATPSGKKQTAAAANAVGNHYKNRYGSEQGFYNALATDPVGVAMDLSTVLSGGAGVMRTAGVAPRVASALETGAAYTNPMTPVVAATSKVAAGPLKGLRRAGEALATGSKARTLLESAEGRGPEIVSALRGNVELVPGSMPTAGEAVSPLNLTRYSKLQETASQVPELATEYFQRGKQQEAARRAAVQSVGKTPEALEAAKSARSVEADELYGLAKKAIVETDDKLLPLLDRPSMDKAFERAAKLAEEAGDKFMLGKAKPEQVVPSSIVDEFGNPVGETIIPAESAKLPVKSLHYVKLALDDLLKNPAEFGIGATEASLIRDTRGQFIKWLETKSPEYGTARQAYAKASEPINQMEIGQFLQGKLTSGLGAERPGVFAEAVKEAPTTIKRAVTGAPRAETLSELLTPQQVSAIESVRADLARGELFRSQTGGAATIGPKASKAASTGLPAMPSLLSRIQTVANTIMKRVAGQMDKKLAIQIATEMLDPKAAAAAMEAAVARGGKVKAQSAIITKGVQGTVNALRSHPALAAGQVTNALSE